MTILQLDTKTYPQYRGGLADLLCATVAGGGSVGFLQPMTGAAALAFWDRHAADLSRGALDLLVAVEGGAVAGTVSLDCALPPNQEHRGDVCKMMVDPGHRRRGIAARLLETVQGRAVARGLSLLVLDTRTGDPAQALYGRMGFVAVGEIPDYARDPDGAGLHGTTLMYRRV